MPPQTQSLRLQLDEVEGNLKDPRRFGDALAILQTQDFQKRDIKRVFNAYSDNSKCMFFCFFFHPIILSVAYSTGPHPPLRLARRPNRDHIGGGGWTPSCGTCL